MSISAFRFALQSALYYWRTSAAVASAVAVATAVLVGALIVGSSMRGSLRQITLQRLGRIDELLIARGFFREELAEEVAATAVFQANYSHVEPVIYFPAATIERADLSATRRASGIVALGVRPIFWTLDTTQNRNYDLKQDEVLINRAVADELEIEDDAVRSGTAYVTLRIPKPTLLPGDSSLGRKRDLVESITRLKVLAIVENEGLARFAIEPSQSLPRNVFLSLGTLQETLAESALRHKADSRQVNMLLFAGKDSQPPTKEISETMRREIQPTLADWGMKLKRITAPNVAGAEPSPIFDYQSLTTEQLVFDNQLAQELASQFSDELAVFTYLVNDTRVTAEPADPKANAIPYSMFSAIDFGGQFEPRSAISGNPINSLADDEVVLNEWGASDLGATVGDTIRLTYFEPESTHGTQREQVVEFRLADIAKLTEPSEPFRFRRNQPVQPAVFTTPPTLANDPDLTPEVPGLTDSESIENWDLPFDTSQRIRPQDDEYWNYYRTTPKGFVNLAIGQKLWGSRFGSTTSFRLPTTTTEADVLGLLRQIWLDEPSWLGMQFVSIKRMGLLAASGTTPFDGLFLGLSMFVIVAALILVSLLFRLGLEQRADQLGLLTAIGFRSSRIVRWWMGEVFLIGLIGAILGSALGVAYAALMIWGLSTFWVEAISRPFLTLHTDPVSLIVGAASGLTISAATIAWTVWRSRRVPVRRLLNGELSEDRTAHGSRSRWKPIAAAICTVLAIVLLFSATGLGGDAQAGAFMGGGFLILVGLMLAMNAWICGGTVRRESPHLDLSRLAFQNARRNPLRSTLTIGLVGVATFLIVAISSFRLRPTEQATGGVDWVAETAQPLFDDLNAPDGQQALLGEEFKLNPQTRVYSCRLKPGQDASCNNLFQATQPRVLGIPAAWIDRFDSDTHSIEWAGSLARDPAQSKNPWRLLDDSTRPAAEPIPCVLDKNTALYSLKIYSVGSLYEVQFDSGEKVTFRVAGFLNNSVLQGCLMVGEADFKRLFPTISGYRYFLIDANGETGNRDVATLEKRLGDQGFDARTSFSLLSQLMGVQNTYLSAFQLLGGLGLLLGTFGLAAVQLRGIFERRRELALMQAVGFRRGRLATLLFLEQAFVLACGLLVGLLAAAFATVPHLLVGAANVPWIWLAIMFGMIGVIGLASGWLASRTIMRLPLIGSLRSG